MNVLARIAAISSCVSVVIAGTNPEFNTFTQPSLVQSPREFSRRVWGVDDGLPQSTPLAIAQTRDGFLWVGTYSGLARFDGLQFTSYTSANTPALVADGIRALLEDHVGDLWIGSAGGLVRYRNREFQALPAKSPVSSIEVNAIQESEDGTLWIGTNRGLYKKAGDELIQIQIPTISSNAAIHALVSLNGSLWIGAIDRVVGWRADKVSHSVHIPKRLSRLMHDQSGKLWVAFAMEPGGVGIIDPDSGALTSISIKSRVTTLHKANDGRLWMGTSSGELLEAIGPTQANITERMRLSDRSLSSLFADKQGNLWVGLESRGLCRLKENLALTYSTEQGLGTPAVSSLLQDRTGTIWAGTFGAGVYQWTNGGFQQVSIGSGIFNATTIAETTDGALWFGTYGGSMIRRNGASSLRIEPAFGTGVRAVCADRDGGLWAAKVTGGCIHFIAGKKKEYTTRDGLAHDQVFAIVQDRHGAIWMATQNGLSRLQAGKFESFFQKDGLGGNDVRSLFLDSRGILWAGTSLGGLARFENGRFTAIRAAHGLINDRIGQIIEDDDRNLWLGSMGGIMKVALQDLDDFTAGKRDAVHAVAFRREEGLLSNECGSGFQPSCLKTDSGQLWFASSHGIIVIDPKRLPVQHDGPPVHIEQIIINGKSQNLRANNLHPISIPPGSQRVEFQFTGVDLVAAAMVRFRYRLKGYDPDWIRAGSRREAVYTHITPGDYQFEVAAIDNQGVWSSQGASLGVQALPYFWQTMPFRITSAILVISAAALIVWRFQNHRFRKKLADLESRHALEIERARIAQDMHDGLGSSLVKISLLGDMAESRLGRDQEVQPDLRRISETARQAVREMDEIVWAVNPRHDTLDSLAGYLGQFAQEHFAGTGIACHLEIPHEFPVRRLSAEVRHNLFLATREALNNILKHSQASHAWFRLNLLEGNLTLVIEDNGCGQIREKRFGDGLENMRQRLNQIRGRTEIASRDSTGTTITFTLPL